MNTCGSQCYCTVPGRRVTHPHAAGSCWLPAAWCAAVKGTTGCLTSSSSKLCAHQLRTCAPWLAAHRCQLVLMGGRQSVNTSYREHGLPFSFVSRNSCVRPGCELKVQWAPAPPCVVCYTHVICQLVFSARLSPCVLFSGICGRGPLPGRPAVASVPVLANAACYQVYISLGQSEPLHGGLYRLQCKRLRRPCAMLDCCQWRLRSTLTA